MIFLIVLHLLLLTSASIPIPYINEATISTINDDALVWCGCRVCCISNKDKAVDDIPKVNKSVARKHCTRVGREFRQGTKYYTVDLQGVNPGNILK